MFLMVIVLTTIFAVLFFVALIAASRSSQPDVVKVEQRLPELRKRRR